MKAFSGSAARRLAALAILTGLSAGCATAASDPAVCPLPVEYDQPFRDGFAAELDAGVIGPRTEQALLDYLRLRDELRAVNP